MKDELGDRIKNQYEDRTRYMLPRRSYTLLRIDGKSFHTYTRGLKKPFDNGLFEDMDTAIIATMSHIQGAVFAYTQSDEISILITDFAKPTTSAWFDGNLQKISSVASSIITAEFNKLRMMRQQVYSRDEGEILYLDNLEVQPLAYFDCRAFTIPDRIEVMNYFIWRNQDCTRNSISMVAQSLFSHKELQGKSTRNMLSMINLKEMDWLTYSAGERNGRLIVKKKIPLTKEQIDKSKEDAGILPFQIPTLAGDLYRTHWVSKPAWKFTEDMDALKELIPSYE